jgi:hypothetical protein
MRMRRNIFPMRQCTAVFEVTIVLSRPHIFRTMSTQASNDRKRKPTELAEAVVSSDDQSPKESKARRVSTDAVAST